MDATSRTYYLEFRSMSLKMPRQQAGCRAAEARSIVTVNSMPLLEDLADLVRPFLGQVVFRHDQQRADGAGYRQGGIKDPPTGPRPAPPKPTKPKLSKMSIEGSDAIVCPHCKKIIDLTLNFVGASGKKQLLILTSKPKK